MTRRKSCTLVVIRVKYTWQLVAVCYFTFHLAMTGLNKYTQKELDYDFKLYFALERKRNDSALAAQFT